jgi:hypothetical protein
VGHTFPQNSQKYLECWLTSIFLICFLKLAPYLVPAYHKSISSREEKPKAQEINVLYLRLRLHCYSSNSQKFYIHQGKNKLWSRESNPENENYHICRQFLLSSCVSSATQLDTFRMPILKEQLYTKLSIVGWYAMDIEALSEMESVSEYSTTSTMSFHRQGKENLRNRY